MKELRIDAVADIESQHVALEHVQSKPGLTEPVLLAAPRMVCCVRKTKDGVRAWTRDSGRLVRDLITFEGVTWWHNGGRYDLRWLLQRCLDWDVVPSIRLGRGGGIGELRIGKSVHRDSFALWGVALWQLAQGSGQEKADFDLACICSRDCGGYCRIRADASPSERARITAYCAQDTEALWAGLHRLNRWHQELNIIPRWSMASSVWHTIRRDCDLPKVDTSRSRHEFAREALYSGRAQAFGESAGACQEVDRSAAYAAEIRLPVPLGESVKLYGRSARGAWDAGREGVYQAVVRVPDMWLPPLPWRSPTGGIYYPAGGTIIGRWARPELAYALTRGCSLVDIEAAQVWASARPYLQEWVDRLAPHRFSGEEARQVYVKNFLATSYGALGQRPMGSTVHVDPYPVKPCPCTAANRRAELRDRGEEVVDMARSAGCKCLGRCCRGCRGECGKMEVFIPHEVSPVYTSQSWRMLDRCHLGAAIYTSARARVALHQKAVEHDGQGLDVIAMDTDSITSVWPRKLDPPRTLGGWRHVHTYESVRIINPRAREGVVAETGEVVRRASGINRAQQASAFGAKVREALAWQLVPLGEGLRNGKSWQQRPVQKTLHARRDRWGQERLGDRVRDGATWRPPLVGECE